MLHKSDYIPFIVMSFVAAATLMVDSEFYRSYFKSSYWYTSQGYVAAWVLVSIILFAISIFALWIYRLLLHSAAEDSYADNPRLNPEPPKEEGQEKAITNDQIIHRLHKAIDAQTKAAFGNLWVAGILTAFAVAILYHAALGISPTKPITWQGFLIGFLPKLSLSLILETSAYFFLRLYKSNQERIASLHQEMSRVQIRLYALARAEKNPAAYSMILLELAHFEPVGQPQNSDYLQHTGGIWANLIQSASGREDRLSDSA